MTFTGSAIVLAAGASVRFGSRKVLAPWRGKTFARAVADALLEAGFERPIFVVRPDDEAVANALPPTCAFAENADPSRGMLSSLLAGLAAVPREARWALVALVDQPAITARTMAVLARAADLEPERIHVAAHGGVEGHPVVFPRWLFSAVRGIPDGHGAADVVDAERAAGMLRVHEVGDPGVVIDVDTGADLLRLETTP